MKTQNEIKVWDIFVRIFHWGLVLAFFIAYFTEDDFMWLHSVAGYVVMGLIGLRLIWGFIGPLHARFSDFAYSPASIKAFVKDTLQLKAKRYIGHNPAGGAMIFLLLISLVLTGISGMVVYAGEDQAGPLAGLLAGMSHNMTEVFEEVHEFFANFTLFLVFVHVGGVIVESLLHHENLVRSMITGRKRVPGNDHGELA
jgi:cytochrome b